MIKDIVVNLSTREDGGVVGDYAVSIADTLGAHIAGIAFVFDPIVPISGTGYIPAEVIETQQADNEAGRNRPSIASPRRPGAPGSRPSR